MGACCHLVVLFSPLTGHIMVTAADEPESICPTSLSGQFPSPDPQNSDRAHGPALELNQVQTLFSM